ncbi:MAG: acyl-CoA thioesterase [Phycisphaerae bacterium]|nr:acyl-CoA thioesterase [Phycisphaerae bacterium]
MSLRVRYYEVDRQNAVHHSTYPRYFEMGRTELLRVNGYDYRTLEDSGIALVVARLDCRYHAPARYDDQLQVTTTTGKIDRVRLEHLYTIVRPCDNVLIAKGSTILVHVDKNGKLQSLPDFLRAAPDA